MSGVKGAAVAQMGYSDTRLTRYGSISAMAICAAGALSGDTESPLVRTLFDAYCARHDGDVSVE